MTEKEYNICRGKILAGRALSDDEAHRFMDILNKFESLLDGGDMEDAFGTAGWRSHVGWDD